MNLLVRELRESTGMTQKAFAELFDIPLSTLRKWEQGEASPPPYVVRMMARLLPFERVDLKEINSKKGHKYYYDNAKKILMDSKGNSINIEESIEGVKEENLPIYVEDLFEAFYEIQERFNRDCRFDREEDIIWS